MTVHSLAISGPQDDAKPFTVQRRIWGWALQIVLEYKLDRTIQYINYLQEVLTSKLKGLFMSSSELDYRMKSRSTSYFFQHITMVATKYG